MKTLKAISALLSYPSVELKAAIPEIRDVVAGDGPLPADAVAAFDPLFAMFEASDVYDLQEAYTLLFDRSRSLSLHLFEHIHGESRDRGQAMVDLKAVYEQAGFLIASSELPDFVPLFLEYCAMQPEDEARALLSQPAHIFVSLAERLHKRGSPFAAAFEALALVAAEKPTQEAFDALMPDAEEDPNDLVTIDAIWEEEEVRFGAGSAAECGIDTLAAKLRQARRPAEGMETPPMAAPRTTFAHKSTPLA